MADERTGTRFEEAAGRAGANDGGFLAELWHFLRHSKKWWLTPMIALLLLYGLTLLVAGNPLTPFLYTLF